LNVLGQNALIPAADTRTWEAILAGFDRPDIYAEPGWARLHAGGAPGFLAVATQGGATLALPLILRELPPPLDRLGWRDAESPYGYPGTLCAGTPSDLAGCWEAIRHLLRGLRVANCFIRLHPFQDLPSVAGLWVGGPHPTVHIPLDQGRDQAFAGPGCHTHRSQVRRALRDGFRAQPLETPSMEDWLGFHQMYLDTMARLGAEAFYRFPLSYFTAFAEACRERMVLVRVLSPGGRVETQAIFMAGPRFAHYHLSGRRAEAHNTASHLLFEAAADWAAERNLAGIHLGGGTTADPGDALFRFKQGIARGEATARFAGLVVDPGAQEALAGAVGAKRSPRFQFYR
jgi:hypothetical protein